MKFIILPVFAIMLFIQCNRNVLQVFKITGMGQGTTYQILYLSKSNSINKKEIDSILRKIDFSLSTYTPTSIISRINNNDSTVIVDDHFTEVFHRSIEVSKETNGVFDVTVAPVINAWGFGFTKKGKIDSSIIDSLLEFVGYSKVRLEGNQLLKEKSNSMLDFNAIAPGYTVDVLATYLENKGIDNYLIELGGELKAKGKKNNNEYWMVGIDQPNEIPENKRPLKAIIKLKDRALATSGNYRKFYVENGQKYAHIINPFTGYPARHNLLSATVIATDCMTADAYATVFMVMGLEKSKRFLMENKKLKLEVFFIYDENGLWKTYRSETLKEWLQELQ